MNCKKIKELLPLYPSREIPSAQETLVEEHLKTCSGCTRELSLYKEIKQTLASLKEESRSPEFWTDYRRELSVKLEACQRIRAGFGITRSYWWKPVLVFARAAAVLLIGLVIGYTISYYGSGSTSSSELEGAGTADTVANLTEPKPVSTQEIENPVLGAKLQPVSQALRTHYDLPSKQGLVISNLLKKSLAKQYGLKRGDIILKINGQPVDIESLNKLVNKLTKLNKLLKTKILRKGVVQVIKIEVKEDNDNKDKKRK